MHGGGCLMHEVSKRRGGGPTAAYRAIMNPSPESHESKSRGLPINTNASPESMTISTPTLNRNILSARIRSLKNGMVRARKPVRNILCAQSARHGTVSIGGRYCFRLRGPACPGQKVWPHSCHEYPHVWTHPYAAMPHGSTCRTPFKISTGSACLGPFRAHMHRALPGMRRRR